MNDTQILPGEMLQRYIHALAEYFCICLEISSRRFLVPLLGNTNPSGDTKKCQHVPARAGEIALHGVRQGAVVALMIAQVNSGGSSPALPVVMTTMSWWGPSLGTQMPPQMLLRPKEL